MRVWSEGASLICCYLVGFIFDCSDLEIGFSSFRYLRTKNSMLQKRYYRLF